MNKDEFKKNVEGRGSIPPLRTIKSKYPEIYQSIEKSWNNDFPAQSFAEKTYNYLYSPTIICENGGRKKYESFSKGYVNCGRNCKCAQKQKSLTMVKRHGVEHPQQSVRIKEKTKQTFVKKFGLENLHEINSDKKKITNIKKYGVEYPLQSLEIREKTASTFKKTYGYKNGFERINSDSDLKQKSINNKKLSHMAKFPEMYDYEKIISTLEKNSYSKSSEILGMYQPYLKSVVEKVGRTDLLPKKSYYETLISNILDSMGVSYIKNSRSIISPKELDFYIPSHKVAIEFNGLRWHGDQSGKDKNYHLSKTEDCEKNKIKLIHIFQDEWDNHTETVIDLIKRQFVCPSNKVFARKCVLKKVSAQDAKIFYNTYHLQGNISSKINYGLYYNEKLISLMSFRIGFDGSSWELTRYCNLPDTIIIGGAKRLFAQFVKEYKPKFCYTYSDRRWFDGEVYKTLGFSHVWNTKPNYWYTRGVHRYHRLGFTKKKLILNGADPNKTEQQIMKDLGYDRIWDCGSKRWEMRF